MRSRRLLRRLWWAAVPVALLLVVSMLAAGVSLRWILIVVAAFGLSLTLLWLTTRIFRRLLWRVGRRLAFSYFLIGVLPIPMVAFLLAVGAYLMAGGLLTHLLRDAMGGIERELDVAADVALVSGAAETVAVAPGVRYARYRQGVRVDDDGQLPERWPAWLEGRLPERLEGADAGQSSAAPLLVALADGTPSVAAAAGDATRGVVAYTTLDLRQLVRDRADIWVDFALAEQEERSGELVDVNILGERFVFQPLLRERSRPEVVDFLTRNGRKPWPIVYGFDLVGPMRKLADGEVAASNVAAALAGSPSRILAAVVSGSREVDTVAWLIFVIPAFLLFDLFVAAWLLAIYMVVGLSRAVNRLSRATEALQEGDFGVRIPVRRRDQLGALQESFNHMAAGIEESVATRTAKERLERELEIAQQVQQSLLPKSLVGDRELEFATFFEPSAAIGGDYFDILKVDEARSAVVVADVSGHGLSAGLRMAMLKAALMLLIEQGRSAHEILTRLDSLVRSSGDGGGFVTLTLAIVDRAAGTLELTNAGHPPTYLLRGGEVREIVLPGPPLGALGTNWGSTSLDLSPEDVLVWLSDGLIEASDPGGEMFGYERTVSALGGGCSDATEVRDRLLREVNRHTDGEPVSDDRTLVVMRFLGDAGAHQAEPGLVATGG